MRSARTALTQLRVMPLHGAVDIVEVVSSRHRSYLAPAPRRSVKHSSSCLSHRRIEELVESIAIGKTCKAMQSAAQNDCASENVKQSQSSPAKPSSSKQTSEWSSGLHIDVCLYSTMAEAKGWNVKFHASHACWPRFHLARICTPQIDGVNRMLIPAEDNSQLPRLLRYTMCLCFSLGYNFSWSCHNVSSSRV